MLGVGVGVGGSLCAGSESVLGSGDGGRKRGWRKERRWYMYVAELTVFAAPPAHSLIVLYTSRGRRRN